VLTGEVKIPTENELTFYTRHGELFAKLCAVLSAIATLAALALRRKW
jgi:apolipoprotein N-acyltransferase